MLGLHVLSLSFWTFLVLSSLWLFPVAVLIWAATVAFDPRLVEIFLAAAPRMIALRDHINQTEPRFTALQEGLSA